MNQKIRELAERSGFFPVPDETEVDLEYRAENARYERFAELIVKECMSMCDETQANYLKHRKATIDFDEKNIFAEGEAASHVIKYKMKKHFGIE